MIDNFFKNSAHNLARNKRHGIINKIKYIAILIPVIACTQKVFSQTQISVKEFAASKTDLSHLKNIQNNLLPFYSITGKTEKHSILEIMSKDNIPGMRMVFIDKGKIIWSANFGYAETSKKIKVDSETVFAGASLSKPITSAIVLKLCDEKNLDWMTISTIGCRAGKIPEK